MNWGSRRGIKVNTAKLNPDKVREIRRLYNEEHYTLRELADIYDVADQTIHKCVTGETWKHVDMQPSLFE